MNSILVIVGNHLEKRYVEEKPKNRRLSYNSRYLAPLTLRPKLLRNLQITANVVRKDYLMNGKQLAKLFHETYERLAPNYGYETRKETKQFDENTPNGKLMIATCSEVLNNSIVQQGLSGSADKSASPKSEQVRTSDKLKRCTKFLASLICRPPWR